MVEKFCRGCQSSKTLDQFLASSSTARRFPSRCKECRAEERRIYAMKKRKERSDQRLKEGITNRKYRTVRQAIQREDGAFDIPLTRGLCAIVDATDLPLVCQYSWTAKKNGNTFYAVRGADKKKIRMHNVILPVEKPLVVDHKDRNGLNNRRSNLRSATPSQNKQNSRTWGRVQFQGVYMQASRKNPAKKRYGAKIFFAGTIYHLGGYDNPEDAARAYDREAVRFYGKDARLNFPNSSENEDASHAPE